MQGRTLCLSFAVVTDQKLQWLYPCELHGETYVFPQTELNQARTNIGLSLSNYGGLFHENITLAYFVFLEELSSGLFSVIGLFGHSDLSLSAGFSNGKRRTYTATSTIRAPNIGRESLLIIEF